MHAPNLGLAQHWRRRLVFASLLLALLALPRLAAAHAVLLEASPHDKAILASPPDEIRLRFNEVVTPTLVEVLDGAGKPVAGAGPFRAIDTSVILPLPPKLGTGVYVISYRVTSADSHPVGGSLVFGVGVTRLDAGTRLAHNTFPDEARWAWLWTLIRATFDAATLLAAGGVLFRALITPRRPLDPVAAELVLAASLAAIAAAILQVAVRGAQLSSAPLLALFGDDPGPLALWRTGFATSLGPSMALSGTGLALIAIAHVMRSRRRSAPLALLGASGAIAGFALTGHAATATPVWLSAPAVALHVLGAAFWLGALSPLYRELCSSPPREAAAVVRRFSALALGFVAALLVCGLVLAAIQLRSPAALLATPYGQRLGVKLVLVAALLALAAVNNRLLTPALAVAAPRAMRWLRRSIIAEIVLLLGIVVAATLLGEVVPPRETVAAAAANDAPGFATMAMTGAAMADIDVTPARPGANDLAIDLTDAQGAPIEAIEVTVWLANPGLNVEARAVKAEKTGPGHYVAAAALLPLAGDWTVTIEALISDFEQTTFTATLPIK